MKIFRVICFVLVCFVMTACGSNQYRVDFDSPPQGAFLVCNGKNWGYTPMSLYYDESVKSYATLNVSNCSANWSSGARSNYPNNLKIFPEGATIITLPRPNVAGYQQDAEFALKVQQMKNQKAQAQAAANARAWQNVNQAIKDMTPETTYTNCNRVYGGVNCTSTTY